VSSVLKQACSDFKEYLASRLRRIEEWRAKSDIAKINEINFASDDEIIRRWLWVAAITSAPVAYLAVPFLISVMQPFLLPQLVVGLWIAAKTVMALVFVVFLGATLFTLKSTS
jgi:hypothetical protein